MVSPDPSLPAAGHRSRRLGRFLLATSVPLMLVALYLPSVPGTSTVPRVDLVVHVGLFALVMWAARLAGAAPRLALAVLAANAVASELVQALLLTGRTGSVSDLVADVVGMGLGLAIPLPATAQQTMMGG